MSEQDEPTCESACATAVGDRSALRAPCCGATRADTEPLARSRPDAQRPSAAHGELASTPMVALAGGTFLMGAEDCEGFPEDGEGPVHEVRLRPFQLDCHATTNEAFARFVDATGYVTDAERYG